MKNKYQEQKDYAIGLLESNCHFTAPEVIDCIDKTLQELIDNYIELVNEKCKKCGDFNIITKIEPLTILCKEKGCKWYGK